MRRTNVKKRKGFTLIELLVVIAIIAVLSIVVILSLNPAELLRQARDSNRISDLATLKSAISLYLADQSTPSIGTSAVCYTALATTSAMFLPTSLNVTAATSSCGSFFTSDTSATSTSARNVTGTGWIPVNFSAISSGAPIGQEPIDPVNVAGTATSKSAGAFFYGYTASSTALTFKLSAIMESVKYCCIRYERC